MVERADEEEGDDCGDNSKTYTHELDLNQAQQEMGFIQRTASDPKRTSVADVAIRVEMCEVYQKTTLISIQMQDLIDTDHQRSPAMLIVPYMSTRNCWSRDKGNSPQVPANAPTLPTAAAMP